MEPKSKLKPYHGLIGLALVFVILIFVDPLLYKLVGIYYAVMGELLIAAIALVIALMTDKEISFILPFRLPPVKMFVSSVGLYIGTLMLTGAVNTVTSRFIPDFAERGEAVNNLATSMSPALAIITIALLPAVCEEIFCRGFLLTSMKPLKNQVFIIIAVAVSFGLLHLDLYTFLPSALIGALFALITIKTGSLLIPMILHFANNSLSVIAAYANAGAETDASAVLSGLSVQATIGYVLFYLGLAGIFFWFSGKAFFGKKTKVSKTVIAVILCFLVSFGGFVAVINASMEVTVMKSLSFRYTDGEPCRYEFVIEKEADYMVNITVVSDTVTTISISDGEKTVMTSESGQTASIAVNEKLTPGNYTLTLLDPDGSEKTSGVASVAVNIIRMK